MIVLIFFFFFFSSRRRHTRFDCDWSSDVCSSDLRERSGWRPDRRRPAACKTASFPSLPSVDIQRDFTEANEGNEEVGDLTGGARQPAKQLRFLRCLL